MVEGNMKKGGQVTIFVIIAIAIVAVIILIFISRGTDINIFGQKSPIDDVRECVREPLIEGMNIVSLQGGSINPTNYYVYQNNKIDYLCYTEENYKTCVMQKPLFKQSVEEELKNYIEPNVNNCLALMKENYENDGFSVSYKEPEIQVD